MAGPSLPKLSLELQILLSFILTGLLLINVQFYLTFFACPSEELLKMENVHTVEIEAESNIPKVGFTSLQGK